MAITRATHELSDENFFYSIARSEKPNTSLACLINRASQDFRFAFAQFICCVPNHAAVSGSVVIGVILLFCFNCLLFFCHCVV